MSTDAEVIETLVRRDQWAGAASRGLDARREREAIVQEILREGHDFGVVPGCGDKPALLKPGAEKIADALNLYPDYEELDKIQDFINRIWFYRYRCRLRQRGTDTVLSTGIGSCNSEAAKYKYRDAQRLCPLCEKPAIIKGREEYGGGWLCFTRKGGCNAKFDDNDSRITEQTLGQIENPDIAALVNTVDKMAQKSAFIAATLNLGFSEQFTQDVDDAPHAFENGQKHAEPKTETRSDVPSCPDCRGQMWDNRATKKGRQPDYKCKDQKCNKAVWLNSENKDVRRTKIQAVSDAFKVLNSLGADPQWTKRSANEFVAEKFDGLDGVDALDNAQLDSLLEILAKRITAAKDGEGFSERNNLIASIRSVFKTEKELNNYLDQSYEGKRVEDMTIPELKALDMDVSVPF